MQACYVPVSVVALVFLLGCGGEDHAEHADAGRADAAIAQDASRGDAGEALAEESEPNNGEGAGELNEFTLPVAVHGAIAVADDIDIFAVDLVAGELRKWSLQSDGTGHAPHLAIAEASNAAPPSVGFAALSGTLSFHHFALKSGRHHFIVRDARNVPAASSEHVGEPGNQYILRSAEPTLAATAVSVPERVSAGLANPFELAFFRFELAQESEVTIEVFAQRAATPSEVDSRLSLYYVTGGDWLITNDDSAAGQLDSKVTGVLPAGEYRVVVDNLNPEAAILSFELDFALL